MHLVFYSFLINAYSENVFLLESWWWKHIQCIRMIFLRIKVTYGIHTHHTISKTSIEFSKI